MNEPGMIAVAGITGVGKTTLAGSLGRLLEAPVIRERYDANPFLPRFLNGDKSAALPMELLFLTDRARQLDAAAFPTDRTSVCDYVFAKNRLFARMNLTPQQFDAYRQAEQAIIPHIAQPQLVVYLRDETDNCIERIRQRGREYEQSISPQWLNRLSDAYDRLFSRWQACPVIHIDVAGLDLRRPETVRQIADELPGDAVYV